MGMLGGLGRGMQQFSVTLQNQQKMDWEAQQQQLQFERQMNLENLRAQNQRDYAQYTNQLQTEREDLNFGRQQSQYMIGDRVLTNAEYDALSPEEKQGVKSVAVKKQEMELDTYSKKLKMEMDQKMDLADQALALDAKQKQQRLSQLQGTEAYKSADPKQQAMMDMAIQAPEVYKLLADSAKGGQVKFDPTTWRNAWKDGEEAWNSLEPEMQKKWMGMAQDVDGDGIVDMEEAKDAYVKQEAIKRSGLMGALKGGEGKAAGPEGASRAFLKATSDPLAAKQAIADPMFSRFSPDEQAQIRQLAAQGPQGEMESPGAQVKPMSTNRVMEEQQAATRPQMDLMSGHSGQPQRSGSMLQNMPGVGRVMSDFQRQRQQFRQ